MVRIQVLKHLPGARKGKSRGSKRDVRGEVAARGAMKKGGCVRIIEGEEVRDDPVKYFLPSGVRKYLLSPRGSDGS